MDDGIWGDPLPERETQATGSASFVHLQTADGRRVTCIGAANFRVDANGTHVVYADGSTDLLAPVVV